MCAHVCARACVQLLGAEQQEQQKSRARDNEPRRLQHVQTHVSLVRCPLSLLLVSAQRMVLQSLIDVLLLSIKLLLFVIELSLFVIEFFEPLVFLGFCLFEWFWKFGWSYLDY